MIPDGLACLIHLSLSVGIGGKVTIVKFPLLQIIRFRNYMWLFYATVQIYLVNVDSLNHKIYKGQRDNATMMGTGHNF